MKHLSPATALPEVHRVARREDMGQKRGGRGLDVHVHDPSTSRGVSANPAKSQADSPLLREPVTVQEVCAATKDLSKIRGCVYYPPITHNLAKHQNERQGENLHTPPEK